jgi:hypothetical protein
MKTYYEVHYERIIYTGDGRRKYDPKYESKIWTEWELYEPESLEEAEKEFIEAKQYLIKENKLLGIKLQKHSIEDLKLEAAE